jgi:endo-1,4-beta-xylanase
VCVAADAPAAQPAAAGSARVQPPEPQPLVAGAKVVTLWPAGSPALKALEGADKPEELVMSKANPQRVQSVKNVHNPSIELHLAPADKANGCAIVVAPGGGNTQLVVGGEGLDTAEWLNSLGVHAFIERYRLRPYSSDGDALADTKRSIRMVRAHAKEWGVDPKKVGIMGFSAGGEQAAWATLKFDNGDPSAADPVERESSRPDFVVLVYPGWRRMDLSSVPNDAPPAFLVSAGADDAFHARQTVEFHNALFEARVRAMAEEAKSRGNRAGGAAPAPKDAAAGGQPGLWYSSPSELHIYAHGGHGGDIKPRKGIPFGTWPQRFVEWADDLGIFKAKGDAPAAAAK